MMRSLHWKVRPGSAYHLVRGRLDASLNCKIEHFISEPEYDEIPNSNTGDYAVISDVLNT